MPLQPGGTPLQLWLRVVICAMAGLMAVELAESAGKIVVVSDVEELGAALRDSSVGVIDLPEVLRVLVQGGEEYEADAVIDHQPPNEIDLDRSLLLRGHPNGTVWEQSSALGSSVLVASGGSELRIEGVTFKGCEEGPPDFQAAARNYRECWESSSPRLGDGRMASGAECSGGLIGPAHSLTPALQPPLIRAGAEGRVVLDNCQVVCNSKDAFVQTAAVVELLHRSGAPVSLERTGSTKMRVSYEGPANLLSSEGGSSIGAWKLKEVVAAWDRNDCYNGGVAVSSGAELQRALSDPSVSRAHLLEPVSTSPEHWPSCGTRIDRPVVVTGCGGTEWWSSATPSHLVLARGGSLTLTRSGSRDQGALVFISDAGGHHHHSKEEEPLNCSSLSSSPEQQQKQHHHHHEGHEMPVMNATDELSVPVNDEHEEEKDWNLDWLKLPGWVVEPGAAVVTEGIHIDMLHMGEISHMLPPGKVWQKSGDLWFEAVEIDLQPLEGRYVFRETLVVCDIKGDEHQHGLPLMEGQGDGSLQQQLLTAAPLSGPNAKSAAEGAGSSFIAVLLVVSGLGALMLISVGLVFASRYRKGKAPKDPGCEDIEEAFGVLHCIDHGNRSSNRNINRSTVSWEDNVVDREMDRCHSRSSAGSKRESRGSASLNGIDDDACSACSGRSSSYKSVTCYIGKGDAEGPRNGRNHVEVFDQLGGSDSVQVYKGLWQGRMVVLKVYPVHLALNSTPEGEEGSDGEEDEEGSGGEERSVAFEAVCSKEEIAIACKMRHPHIVHVHAATSVPHRWMPVPGLQKLPKPACALARSKSAPASAEVNEVADEAAEEAAGEAVTAAPWAMHVIQEFCIAGSLRERLQAGEIEGQEGPETPPNLGTSLTLAYDAACGMAYLHRKKVVHGNLTSRNVLLGMRACGDETQDSFYAAKIADHSLRSLMNGCGSTGGINSTRLHRSARERRHDVVAHLAPETLTSGRVLAASDVYAFGMILHELFSGKAAFEGKTMHWIIDHVVAKRQQPVFPAATLRPIVQLASRCMMHEAEHRPSFQEIKGLLRELLQKHATDPSHGISAMQAEISWKRSSARRASTGYVAQSSPTVAQTTAYLYASSGSFPEVSSTPVQGQTPRKEEAPSAVMMTTDGPKPLRMRRCTVPPTLAKPPPLHLSDPEAGDDVRNLQLGGAAPAQKPKMPLPEPAASATSNALPPRGNHERPPYLMLTRPNKSKSKRLSTRRTSALMRVSLTEEPEELEQYDQQPNAPAHPTGRMSLELPAKDQAVVPKRVNRFSVT